MTGLARPKHRHHLVQQPVALTAPALEEGEIELVRGNEVGGGLDDLTNEARHPGGRGLDLDRHQVGLRVEPEAEERLARLLACPQLLP